MARGWQRPHGSRKWHYFVDGRSLCGKWVWFSPERLVNDINTGPDDCKACVYRFHKKTTLGTVNDE